MQIMAIYGPTGSGKTKLALQLAQSEKAPLISIDSRKVYREMNIGTHKQPLLDYAADHPGQSLYGIDWLSPAEQLNVQLYQERVYGYIAQRKLEKVIFFGGSGLYLDTILFGLSCQQIKPDVMLRQKLEPLSLEEVQCQMKKVDRHWYESLTHAEQMNKRRLIRKIEITQGRERHSVSPPSLPPTLETANTLTLYLPATPQVSLFAGINQRVVAMFQEGWLTETAALLERYSATAPGLQIMGYREIIARLQTDPSLKVPSPALIEEIQLRHRQYAKRQLTWAKRYRNEDWQTFYPQRSVHYEQIRLESYV